jgi:hypothetical protein
MAVSNLETDLSLRYKAPAGRLIVLVEPRHEGAVMVPDGVVEYLERYSPVKAARLATVVSCGSGELKAGERVWVDPDPQLTRGHAEDAAIPDGKELWFFGAMGEKWRDSVYGRAI